MLTYRIYLAVLGFYLALSLPSLAHADDKNASFLWAGGQSAQFQGTTYRVDSDGGLTVESGSLVRKNWIGWDGRIYENRPTTGFFEISEILTVDEAPQQLVVLNRQGQTLWFDRSKSKFIRFSPLRMRVAQMITDGKQLYLVEALLMAAFQPQSPDSYRVHACRGSECSPFGEIQTTVDKDSQFTRFLLSTLQKGAQGYFAGSAFLSVLFLTHGQYFQSMKLGVTAAAAFFIAREIMRFTHADPLGAGLFSAANELNKSLIPADPAEVSSKFIRQLDRDGVAAPVAYESLRSRGCGKGLPSAVGKDIS